MTVPIEEHITPHQNPSFFGSHFLCNPIDEIAYRVPALIGIQIKTVRFVASDMEISALAAQSDQFTAYRFQQFAYLGLADIPAPAVRGEK